MVNGVFRIFFLYHAFTFIAIASIIIGETLMGYTGKDFLLPKLVFLKLSLTEAA